MEAPLTHVHQFLLDINAQMGNQGRFRSARELMFYTMAFAYSVQLTERLKFSISRFNKFDTADSWLTVLQQGRIKDVVDALNSYGPFLPLDQIDAVWNNVPGSHTKPVMNLVHEEKPLGWFGRLVAWVLSWFYSFPKEQAVNQINVIKPYLWNGIWVFDDPERGLDKEALVEGMPEIILTACQELGIENPEKGFVAVFSKDPFPSAKLKLEWVREEMGGNVYKYGDQEGWLCPALFKYFDEAPRQIHIDLKKAS